MNTILRIIVNFFIITLATFIAGQLITTTKKYSHHSKRDMYKIIISRLLLCCA